MQKNLNPKSKPSQDEMAELKKLFQLNELDALEEKTKKLIGIYPKISILYNILGVVFQKKNKLSDAIFNFNKAMTSRRIQPINEPKIKDQIIRFLFSPFL